MRFLARGELRPGASLPPADPTPELQYLNQQYLPNPLANLATDREEVRQPLTVNFYKIVADYLGFDTLAAFDISQAVDEVTVQVRSSLFYRILYGYGVLVYLNGRLKAVNPRHWWPLMEQGNRIGSVFVIPYSTKSISSDFPGISGAPDMAIVCQPVDGQNSRLYTCAYNGVTLGNVFSPIQGGVDRVAVYGDGKSDFPLMVPTVDAIDSLLKAGNRIIDRHSQPHLQVPSGMVQFDKEGRPSFALSKNGSILPISSNDKDVKYISPQTDANLMEFLIELQISLLAAKTGVPISAFNIFPLSRMESGHSIEQLSQVSNDKVLQMSLDLERALKSLGISIPRIQEEQNVDTASNPSPSNGTRPSGF